jgi:chromosome segregation ATPase
MPTGIPNSGHRRPANFQVIRQLKHELRVEHKVNADIIDQLNTLRDELEKLHMTEHGLRADLNGTANQLVTCRALNDRLREDLVTCNHLRDELRNELNFRESQYKEFIKQHDVAVAQREFTERKLEERTDKLITIADALARNQ